MFLLLVILISNTFFITSSSSTVPDFDNSILPNQPWPVDNCQIIPEENKCKVVTNPKDTCRVCDENGNCKLNIAILSPNNSDYILNLQRVTEKFKDAEEVARSILNITYELKIMDDECRPEVALGNLIDINEWCPHVIFGIPCDYTLASVGRVLKTLGNAGTPLLSPGGFTFNFILKKTEMSDEFYHLVNTGYTDFTSLAEFLHLIVHKNNWKKVALMYEKPGMSDMAGEGACYLLMSTIINNELSGINYLSGDLVQRNYNDSKGYNTFLKEFIGVKYGVILTCANHTRLRKMVIEAAKLGMMDRGEYIFLNFALYNNANKSDQPWYDPDDQENDELAKKAFNSVMTFYPFREAIFENVEKQNYRGSFYLDDIYESVLIYIDTIKQRFQYRNVTNLRGCDVIQDLRGKKYFSSNENITLNCNAQKLSKYALVAQENGISKIIGIYSIENKTVDYWNPGNITFPADEPQCGFDLSKCPTYDKVNVLLVSLISVIFIGFLIVAIIVYRQYKLRAEIYSEAWKVNYNDIVFLSKDKRSSIHSLIPIKEIDDMSLAGDTQLFATIGHYRSIRVAIKKLPDIKLNLKRDQLYELKIMKDLSNDNLVKFYGVCIESPHNCLLVEYCQKGSLQDILENSEYNLDWTFRLSLIMDLVRGMHYLHGSAIKSHGALKSSNCLVDSRFVLKISDFGLHFLKGDKHDETDKSSYEYWKRLLWTAPELLRMDNPPPNGTQKGDVYSFAIIMHEIIMREGVFYVKGLNLEPKGEPLGSNS